MSNELIGGARAAIGQGLMAGWGDESEAWLRSKLGQGDENKLLADIRSEQALYSKENPWTSGIAEFGGGVIPGVVTMLVPGGQALGAAQIQRSGALALAKLAGLGLLTGAVSGAGSANEGNRIAGATSGGLIGGTLGVGMPLVTKAGTSAGKWLRGKLNPSESFVEKEAARKMNAALADAEMTPKMIAQQMADDARMGVPSVIANVSIPTAKLTEAVAQRAGKGATKIEKDLTAQRLGARERTHQQVVSGLKSGDYYLDEERLIKELRDTAKNVYDDAYTFGKVSDPRITEVLKTPEFKLAFDKAKSIAKMEASAAKLRGEDPAKFELSDIYTPGGTDPITGITDMVLSKSPDVRTLDYIKRGVDAIISSSYKGTGMSTAEAAALKGLRNEFVGVIDELVPAYKTARKTYAGDMEVRNALNAGMNEFNKMDHEQVIKLVSKMGDSEKNAFRTGVSRDLYSKVMDPTGNFNAAQRIIGSPESQAPPGQFELFKNALEREAQLFYQSNRILGGSQTSQRDQMRGILEGSNSVGDTIGNVVTGGFWSGLQGLVSKAIRNQTLSEDVANKLSTMLMSKDPNDVAAVVKILEKQAAATIPKAKVASTVDRGIITGTSIAIHPDDYQGQPISEIDDNRGSGLGDDTLDIEEAIRQDDAIKNNKANQDLQ